MPPKPKYQREEIVTAAMKILRERGAEALTARELGAALGTSARPIFTAFQNMEEVREAVVKAAWEVYEALRAEEIAAGKYPAYKAMGMAYIRMAREERRLFQLLFMRDRTGEPQPGHDARAIEAVRQNTGLSEEDAVLFQTEMWSGVHGIAVMLATGFLELTEETAARMVTDLYQGLRRQWEEKE